MNSRKGQATARRTFTAAVVSVATLGSAGCLGGDGQQVRVDNRRPGSVTIHVEIFHVDPTTGQQVFTDDTTIPASEVREYDNLFAERGTKQIVVETDDGQRGQYEWGADPGSGSGYLSVRIDGDTISFDIVSP